MDNLLVVVGAVINAQDVATKKIGNTITIKKTTIKSTIMNKTIYKRDSKGKLRFLHVFTEGAKLIQESGLHGTTSPTVHVSISTAKNVGKTNETTPEQQAELDGDNKIAAKLRSGYSESIEAINQNSTILPMLAKDYKKEKSKINWGTAVLVQPKLDGQRCIAVLDPSADKVVLWSRTGKEITTCQHIVDDLEELREDLLNTMVLDGELYAHELTFQENMKLIKKYRPNETEQIKYHVYDLVYDDLDFYDRYAVWKREYVIRDYEHTENVPTFQISTENELLRLHAQFLEQGYEGTIVRHGDAGYKQKSRSSNLLKYKDFIDAQHIIVNVIPSEKRPEHGVVVCALTESGDTPTFKANPKMSHAQREELLTNKQNYIGQWAEIRYFERTDDGLPRFPVFVGVRNDK